MRLVRSVYLRVLLKYKLMQQYFHIWKLHLLEIHSTRTYTTIWLAPPSSMREFVFRSHASYMFLLQLKCSLRNVAMIDRINIWNIALLIDHNISFVNVTLHDKTKHNVLITDFELRSPLPTTILN